MYYTKIAISIHGESAHGSTPHLGKDAIVAASSVILNAQTLVSRMNNPLKPMVLTFSGVNGGTQFNIITDLVKLTAYLYAGAASDLTEMQPKLTAICQSTAAALGCTAELDFGSVCEGGAAE